MQVEQQSSNKAKTDIEEKIPLARRLVRFKHDRLLQSQRVTTQYLPQILNIGNSADIKHITCDVIQAPVEITERIRLILLAKQEILSLLGIRAFLVTDREDGELTTEALETQLEIHGTKVSAITTTHRSLLVRGLLLFDISHKKVGSSCDLCFLDLEQPGRQRDRKTPVQILKSQVNKGGEGKYSLEKQYEAVLKELEMVCKEAKHLKHKLDKTMEDRNEKEKQREQAKQEAEVFKTQLDHTKEGKSVLEKLCQERLEELAKAEKITSEKAIEITSLKKKIHNLETKLAESGDSMTKMQAQPSKAETELAESRNLVAKMQVKLSDAEREAGESKELVTKMQAKLSDAESKALESDTLRDQLDKTKKEVAQLIDQLEIAQQERDEIEEELGREKKEKSLPQALGTDASKLERGVKEEVDSGGVFSRLRKFVTGDSVRRLLQVISYPIMDSLTDKIYDKENCIYLSQCEDDFYYPEEQSVVSEAKSTLTTQDVSSTEPLPGPSTSTTLGVAVKQRFASVLTEDALNHQIALQKTQIPPTRPGVR
ncbi:uncharacterized protein MCAP_0864-like [Ptychodera flava]|uniref:uncharacterized protein MCAP_0864-like n=1 Tax=Ptychodera flava TaxID=63121 RepID=UPI00396A860B